MDMTGDWVLDRLEGHTPFGNLMKAVDPSAGKMLR